MFTRLSSEPYWSRANWILQPHVLSPYQRIYIITSSRADSHMVLTDRSFPRRRSMEKPKGRRWNMKTHLCIPRIGGNTCTNNTSRLSPTSLLERFREAVFRLIMLSALSKATNHTESGDVRRSYHPQESHRSDAVAECIEFIKKSASADETHDPIDCSSSIDATTELVVPVPVI